MIVPVCRRMGLLRKRKLASEERLGFSFPANPFVVSQLLSAAKRGSINIPSECAGSPDTKVYDECCG